MAEQAHQCAQPRHTELLPPAIDLVKETFERDQPLTLDVVSAIVKVRVEREAERQANSAEGCGPTYFKHDLSDLAAKQDYTALNIQDAMLDVEVNLSSPGAAWPLGDRILPEDLMMGYEMLERENA